MTPEKRKKIKALLNNSATTENEKEICRKLLKDTPETPTPEPGSNQRLGSVFEWQTPRGQQSGARQQAARERQREAAARQQAAAQQAGGLFGQGFVGGYGGGGLFGMGQQAGAGDAFLNELARIMAEDFKKGEK